MEKIEKNEELGAEKPTKAIALKYDKENRYNYNFYNFLKKR